jgi:hypothetical protein
MTFFNSQYACNLQVEHGGGSSCGLTFFLDNDTITYFLEVFDDLDQSMMHHPTHSVHIDYEKRYCPQCKKT